MRNTLIRLGVFTTLAIIITYQVFEIKGLRAGRIPQSRDAHLWESRDARDAVTTPIHQELRPGNSQSGSRRGDVAEALLSRLLDPAVQWRVPRSGDDHCVVDQSRDLVLRWKPHFAAWCGSEDLLPYLTADEREELCALVKRMALELSKASSLDSYRQLLLKLRGDTALPFGLTLRQVGGR